MAEKVDRYLGQSGHRREGLWLRAQVACRTANMDLSFALAHDGNGPRALARTAGEAVQLQQAFDRPLTF